MIQTRNVMILLALLLAKTLADEEPEPIFKAHGGELEMGFCFGDDIAVYKMTAEGKELLGQASSPLVPPPDAFKGRISISNDIESLLGLKITNLQFSDSGIYIRECWNGETMENYRKHYLYVCNEEFKAQQITLTPRTGADLVCNMGSRENATVKWYKDVHNMSLFMDTKISLEPLQAEFKSLIQVKDEGSSLHVSDDFIQDRPQFFCLVMEDEQCRSFQTIGLPEEPETKTIYRSVGERVVLRCLVDPLRESHWKTPSGQVISWAPIHFKGTTVNQISMSTSMNLEDNPLVINLLSSEHSGSYKCFSTFLLAEYVVNVCPLRESTEISYSVGDSKVVLQCDFLSLPEISGKVEHASVLWYQNTGEDDILIMDSGDPSLKLPKGLKGRVSFSQVDSSLIFTDPKKEDNGTYWCVVLLDSEDSNEVDDEDAYTSDEEDNEDDEEEYHQFLMEEDYMDICLFRQVTHLKLRFNKSGGNRNLRTENYEIEPTVQPEPEPATNLTIYAVCAGIGALLLVALIGVVVVLKKRAKASSASMQGRGLELSQEEGRALKHTTA